MLLRSVAEGNFMKKNEKNFILIFKCITPFKRSLLSCCAWLRCHCDQGKLRWVHTLGCIRNSLCLFNSGLTFPCSHWDCHRDRAMQPETLWVQLVILSTFTSLDCCWGKDKWHSCGSIQYIIHKSHVCHRAAVRWSLLNAP